MKYRRKKACVMRIAKTSFIVMVILFIYESIKAAPTQDSLVSTYSNCISRSLPAGWYVSAAFIARCPWYADHQYIGINIKKDKIVASDKQQNIRLPSWHHGDFVAEVVFISKEYEPTRASNFVGKMPYPLIGRNNIHQIFLWGNPSQHGWSNSVPQLIRGLSKVDDQLEWIHITDSDLAWYEESFRTTNVSISAAECVKIEWEKQVKRLSNYCAKGTAFIEVPPQRQHLPLPPPPTNPPADGKR